MGIFATAPTSTTTSSKLGPGSHRVTLTKFEYNGTADKIIAVFSAPTGEYAEWVGISSDGGRNAAKALGRCLAGLAGVNWPQDFESIKEFDDAAREVVAVIGPLNIELKEKVYTKRDGSEGHGIEFASKFYADAITEAPTSFEPTEDGF